MQPDKLEKENLEQILRRYIEEDTYSFSGLERIDVNTKGLELETPLHMACTRGARDDVALLLAGGADVNAKTDVGTTPLHRAVGSNSDEIVEMLLDFGAAASCADDFGETPITKARRLGQDTILSRLLESEVERGPKLD